MYYLIVLFLSLFYISKSNYIWSDTSATSSKFAHIVETPYFIDKTEMIKVFFQGKKCKVFVATPRYFGKSANIDMLHRFCEVSVDKNGNKIPKNETKNYSVFSNKYKKIKNYEYLDVFKDKDFFEKHFGQYPVIFLNFKKLNGTNFSSFEGSLRILVEREFRRHSYLLKTNCMSKYDEDYFNQFCSSISTVSKIDLIYSSLKFLSEILHKYFKRRVIVLIDNFDHPIQNAIFESGKFVKQLRAFFDDFTSTLMKLNPNIDRVLATGCLMISGVLSSGLKNIEHLPFSNEHRFTFYFGFTENEMCILGKRLNLKEDIMRDIKKWYGGFRVIGTNSTIYNVYSVEQFLKSRVFRIYWFEQDYQIHLRKLCFSDLVHETIRFLVLHNYTEIYAIYTFSVDDILHLEELACQSESIEVEIDEANLYINLLLALGYFTVVEQYILFGVTRYNITIPNNEIKQLFKRSLNKA